MRSGEALCFDVHVSDALNNPIVAGSTVTARTSGNLETLGVESAVVPDAGGPCVDVPSACDFEFCVFAPGSITSDEPSFFSAIVESPLGMINGGNGSAALSLLGINRAMETPPAP